MKWAHLPMPGGIFDQHPELLDRFEHIFRERSKEDKRREAIRMESGPKGRRKRTPARRR